jgi:hypothetical protein
MQYSDGVDKAFTVKAAWELYQARRAGRGPGVSDTYAELLKDWDARGQVTNNPGGASSSSIPAAKPPSQPFRLKNMHPNLCDTWHTPRAKTMTGFESNVCGLPKRI